MPPVTIFTKKDNVNSLQRVFPELTQIIADELSCPERKLIDKDIHMSVVIPEATYNAADTRMDIYAFGYPDRIKRQDDICYNIKQYVTKNCPTAGSVDVFLMLGELGYSFDK